MGRGFAEALAAAAAAGLGLGSELVVVRGLNCRNQQPQACHSCQPGQHLLLPDPFSRASMASRTCKQQMYVATHAHGRDDASGSEDIIPDTCHPDVMRVASYLFANEALRDQLKWSSMLQCSRLRDVVGG